MKKSHKRQYTYDEIIKEFILFADADAEEIGKAVIESFMESERYYNMGYGFVVIIYYIWYWGLCWAYKYKLQEGSNGIIW